MVAARSMLLLVLRDSSGALKYDDRNGNGRRFDLVCVVAGKVLGADEKSRRDDSPSVSIDKKTNVPGHFSSVWGVSKLQRAKKQ